MFSGCFQRVLPYPLSLVGKTKSTVKAGSWSTIQPPSGRSDNRTLFCQNPQEVNFKEPVKRYSWRDTLTSEQLEWRHLFYRGAPKSSKNKKNILRTFPLVRNFTLKVATNFLEHSSANQGLPLPLGRGVCETKSKNGRSRPRKPFISWVFCAQKGFRDHGLRPWSRKGPDHGVGVDPETVS